MSSERDIARAHEMVADVRGDDGTRSVTDQLIKLIDRLNLAAREIDPSITKVWVGTDDDGEGRFRRPFSVVFEREGSPFCRRSA